MKKMTKIMSLLLAVVMVFTMAACNPTVDPSGSSSSTTPSGSKPTSSTPDGKASYVVKVQSAGGLALSNVDIEIREGDNLLTVGRTAKDGTYTFKLAVGKEYNIELSNVPKGYEVRDSYSFNGNSAVISLASAVISDESISGTQFKLGDIMYDFQFVDSEGVVHKLSETLAEKKMVMLNFWSETCTYCWNEFEPINNVYNDFANEIEIFALNDAGETMDAVLEWKTSLGLDMPMGLSTSGLGIGSFGFSGRPTTVIIDRYGMIAMAHAGAITSGHVWRQIFLHFTAENYEQILVEDYEQIVPEQEVTEEFPGSDAIGEAINSGTPNVTYRPGTGEGYEYAWPFIVTEYEGESCIKASNSRVDSAQAFIFADVELKAGQAIGFDYLISSELASDIAAVIVNGEDIYQMSGYDVVPEWKTCYPWVALEDGVYEVAICYLKDGTNNHGDDTIYIDNLRVVDQDEIEVDCYIPRQAAVENEDGEFEYVDVFYNEADGYYHVGSENGPLLLANLQGYTQFNSTTSVYLMAIYGELKKDGHDYYEDLTPFASYASNASLNGYCTVTRELAEILKVVAQIKGYEGTEGEWLKICEYYEAYGPNGTHLEDPIKGLAPFSAPEAVLGKWHLNETTNEWEFTAENENLPEGDYNFYYYDRAIMPKGMFYKFTPEVSGAYRITSHASSAGGTEAWLFTEDSFNNRVALYTYAAEERIQLATDGNVSICYYMEAGQTYYIDIAFWDVYEVGYIPFDMEFLGETYNKFLQASPGYFTFYEGAEGHYIAGGIDVYLGEDNIYYHLIGEDENGDPILGSPLYADFTLPTVAFTGSAMMDTPVLDKNGNPVLDENGQPVYIKGNISMGGFDFRKTEYDHEILAYLANHDGNVEATRDYLKVLWGEDYEKTAEAYMLEEIFKGQYHGKGQDMTAAIEEFLDDVIDAEGQPHDGCVIVTKELAELLQMLMDKYTFPGVDHSWTKVCYYYERMGQ